MLRRIILAGAGLALVPLLIVVVRHQANIKPAVNPPAGTGVPASVRADEDATSARLADDRTTKMSRAATVRVVEGTLQVRFPARSDGASVLQFAANGALEGETIGDAYTFPLAGEGHLTVASRDGLWTPVSGQVISRGGLLLLRHGQRTVIGNLGVGVDRQGRLAVMDTLDDTKLKGRLFDVGQVIIEWDGAGRGMSLAGPLVVAEEWAARLGEAELSGKTIGAFALEMKVELVPEPPATSGTESCAALDAAGRPLAASTGPDIIVADLQAVQYYGSVGGIHAYAVGTNACNVGSERASWVLDSPAHPVIVQNMYRLRSDRFEQIGMSWVKHGFYAVSQNLCGQCNDQTDGTALGVGCSDPYSASMNGVQTNMSPRSTILAFTGQVTYPWPGWITQPVQTLIERRIQVRVEDVDPALNPAARYFVQGHYVAADDAAAGNHFNNASYREVVVAVPSAGRYFMLPTGITHRLQPAVRAWQDVDPTVVESEVTVPGEGLFILAGKSVLLSPGQWRYIYALQNLNSDRAARRLAIPLPSYAVVTNVTFHDVPYHSGEPYDSTDWAVQSCPPEVSWSTDDALTNVNANALRWGNVYTYSFECNAPPAPATATIGLFVPGVPSEVTANTVGPLSYFVDCNDNTLEDRCEISCDNPLCGPPCGGVEDCDGNFVPDECETDCDGNGVNDVCDLRDDTHEDCNDNFVPDVCDISSGFSSDLPPDGIPDECQADCNENGIPDNQDIAANPSIDCDVNGVPDVCELIGGDCNLNLRLDVCDLALGSSPDCNGTEIPDECELAGNDCNDNDIPDECDADCDGNGVPDACQPFLDCNNNTIQDICDVAADTSNDCDLNWIPDECQPDCDDDGIIDPCDNNPDSDGDTVWDCYDLCPTTTPPGTCTCPDPVRCCLPPGLFICVDISLAECLDFEWIPSCMPQPCRDGCLIGDADGDGDRDLADVAALQSCYSGDADWAGFVPVAGECARIFDEQDDGAVDLGDYQTLEDFLTGPM